MATLQTLTRLLIDVQEKPVDKVTAVQNDTNTRYMDVYLYNNGIPIDLTGMEVRLYVRKPDKMEVWNNGEITEPTNGRCQFPLTNQTLAAAGYAQAEISIWQDNERILSTQQFTIYIVPNLRSDSAVESTNEYGALVALFQELYESKALMQEMVQSFGTAGDVAGEAGADTFWKLLEAVYSVNKDALENASVSEVLERIGQTTDEGATDSTGTVMGKVNNIIANQQEKQYTKIIYTENGVFKVPKGIDTIYITACGGGAGGHAGIVTTAFSDGYTGGGGGGGGDAINRKIYNVAEDTEINIVIGKGGEGGIGNNTTYSTRLGDEATLGKVGGNTVIGNLVTLSGGRVNTSENREGGSGSGVGGSGGRGQWNDSDPAKDGSPSSITLNPLDIFFSNIEGGSGGSGYSTFKGGGGGGSMSSVYGRGGNGGSCSATKGFDGSKGKDGIVIIEYGDILGLVQKI